MIKRYLKWRASLNSEQVLSLTAYILGIFWGISMMVFPSRVISEELLVPHVFIYLWSSLTPIGAIIAIRGAIRKDNLVVELLGLQILSLGPITYAITMFVYVFISIFTGQQITTLSPGILGAIAFVLLRKRAARLKLRVNEVKEVGEE